MNDRKWTPAFAVVREPRGNQARVEFSIAEVRMGWKANPQQAASVVVRGINQTCGYLPVDVLSLPGAAAYENYRYGGVSNILVADSPFSLLYRYALVDYVAGTDRFVHDMAGHHLDEPVFVLLVFLMVVTNEDLAPSRSSHALIPNNVVCGGDSVARGVMGLVRVSGRHTRLA